MSDTEEIRRLGNTVTRILLEQAAEMGLPPTDALYVLKTVIGMTLMSLALAHQCPDPPAFVADTMDLMKKLIIADVKSVVATMKAQ
jgi:hypothetical protein